VQETLVAALEGLDRYAGESSLGTWLFGILKHKIVDAFRRSPREEPLELNEDDVLHEGPGPEQSCASRNALAVIDRSLGRLPRKTAHAFVLREVLGMDTVEACRMLQITPTHCWVLVHRARERLRACPEVSLLAAEAG
jgi:RNA polymerase sigma-70 factor (ECF subfamily)